MEEKILKLPTAPTFDLQRFANTELENGAYKLKISDTIFVTCNFTGIDGITTSSSSTSLVTVTDSTKKITAGGKTFTVDATKNGSITFNGTSSAISSINICDVSAKIGSITYTSENSTINFNSNNQVEIDGNVDISGTVKSSTFTLNSGKTATINDVDYKSNGGTSIAFGSANSTVILTGAFTVGNGSQNLKLSINDVTYNGAGKITITNSAITIAGEITASENLDAKVFNTNGTDLNATISLEANDKTKIDSVTYSTESSGKVQVTAENITLTGTLTVGTGTESLNTKNYIVSSGQSTFKPTSSGSVTVNDVTYSSKSADSIIKVESDESNVTAGKFNVTFKGSTKLNGVNISADSDNANATFTYDETNGFKFSSGTINLTADVSFKVDGATYQGDGTLKITSSAVVLDGDFEITDAANKTFTHESGNVQITLDKNKYVTVNGVKYTAKDENGITLTFDDDTVAVNGVTTIEGTITDTKITIVNSSKTITINSVDFKGGTDNAEIAFKEENEVEIQEEFIIGNGSQSLNGLTVSEDSYTAGSTFNLGTNDEVKVGGVTYSGNGKIKIDSDDEDKISLSNGSVTVGDGTETLSGKSFTTTEGSAANFNVAAEDSVTINDQKFEADSSSSSGGTSTPNTIKISADNETEIAGAFTFEETNEDQSFNIAQDNSVTYGNIKYTAKSSSTKVTVNSTSKKITVTEGSIAIGSAETTVDLSGYLLKIISSAQINGVDFTKTSGTPDADVVFDATNGTITLNSAFTVGDGRQFLDGLKIALADSVSAQFNLSSLSRSADASSYTLSSGSDSVTVDNITYTGTGNVDVDGTAVTLDGTIAVTTESTGTVNGYTFTVTGGSGKSYNFGATTIDATATSGNISVSGITGALESTTSLSSVMVGSSEINLTNGTSTDGYSITLAANGTVTSISGLDGGATITDAGGATSISTQGTGTFTVDSQTFYVTNGTITFNLENGSVKTITTENSATVSVGNGAPVTFSNGDTLQQYNGTWGTAPSYDSYFISGGTVYGIYSDGNSETAATSSYTSDLTLNGSTVTLTGNKPVKVTGTNFTVNSNSKVYTVNGTANFRKDNTDADGITEIESGSVTAAEGVAIGVSLGANAALAVGTKYTYTEIDNSATSATINVDANGTLSVTDGKVKKSIANGNTFTFKEETYTAGSSPAEFTVTQGTTDGASLTGGEGSRSISSGTTFALSGTTYTAIDNDTKFVATGNSNGGFTAFSGNAQYKVNDTSFTINEKNYTNSTGNIIYKLTGTGTENGTSTSLLSATGTRAGEGANETATYNGDTYTVTSGTYTIEVTGGTGTETLTSGSATYETTAGGNFHYDFGGTNREYVATSDTTLKISFDGDTQTRYHATGGGTRSATSTETTTDDGYTYNLDGSDKILLTLDDTPAETFHDGTATRTINNSSTDKSFKVGTTTYTANNLATLTLTKSNGGDATVALTGGSGTREDSAGTFEFYSETYDRTSDKIVYQVTSTASDTEKVFAATGTRAYDGGNVTYASDSYTTAGTYALTVADGSSSAYTVDATGTYSTTDGAFHYDGKTYTGFDGGATFTISYTGDVDNPTTTQTSTSGKGTRNAAANGETVTATDTDGYTYNLDGNDKILLTLGNSPSEVFYSGTATRSIASGGEFKTNSKTYTADSATTFTLGKSSDTDAGTITFVSGSGTRSDTADTFTVTGVDGTYTTTSDKIVYQVKPNEAEKVFAATGTRAYGDVAGESNVTFNQDSYTTTGTYSLTVTDGTAGTPTLTAAGTYSAGNGQTFHYNHNGNVTEYVSSGTTTLTISYNGTTPTAALTNARGAGTRTLSSGSFSHTSSDGNTYNVNTNSKIKVDITDATHSTETFYSGTATQTYAANSSFNYNRKIYTAYDAVATLTLTMDDGTENSVTLTGKGTRTDYVGTFTYNSKTYNKTSGEITYIVESSPTERTFIATGTRSAQGDAFTGNTWGNVYTLAAGSTYSIELTAAADGTGTDVVSTGNATQSFATFLYDHDNDGTAETYTATNDGATFSLSVTNDVSTETFSSGSGKRTNGANTEYVIKTTAPIGGVSYTADNGGIVKVTTNAQNEITALESSITGTFNGNNTSKINGITFGGTGTLQVNDTTSVTATNGTFTAEGDFSTARTLSRKTLHITGDSDNTVRATFNGSAITQIENLSNGASVVNAGGATTVITDGNGTFTFGSQTFAIAHDATAGVTFTLNAEGIVTQIESFQRADDGAYITVDITDGGETYNLKLRHSGDILTRNESGDLWTEPDVIQMYVVTYNGTFTVEALDTNGDIITINNGDYSSDGTKLTLNDTSKPVVVKNSTSTQITVGVGAETNVNSTGSKAIKIIDDEGHFKLGTLSDDKKTFTVSDETPGNFEVSKDGEVNVGENGKITVIANGTNTVQIEIPSGSNNVNIQNKNGSTNGSFSVNGQTTLIVKGSSSSHQVIIGNNGAVTGINPGGIGTFTIFNLGSSSDLAENADLAESADVDAGVAVGGVTTTFQIGDCVIIVVGDEDGVISYTTNGTEETGYTLTGLSDVSEGATIKLFGSVPSSIKVNADDAAHTVSGLSESNNIINYNSVTDAWYHNGTGAAAVGSSEQPYKIELADGKVYLYTKSGKQTKNVADYTAALGSTKPDKDGGTLPNYVSGISAETGKVSEVVVKAAGTYSINGKSFTVSGETTFKPTDSDAKNFSSIDVTLEPNQSLRYNNISYSGNNGANVKVTFDGNVTLDGNAKIEGSYSTTIFAAGTTATSTVTFGKIVVKDLSSTAINFDAVDTLTIGSDTPSKTLKVEGDDDYTFSVSSKKLTGISDGAKITSGLTAALEVNTDSEGVFEIGGKKFTIAGDSNVTFKTNTDGEVTEISNLNGTVKGDATAFSSALTVNTQSILVSGGATEITLTADSSGVSKIHVVGNGNAIIFGTGDKARTYKIGSGEADFLMTNGDFPIKGITNITGTTEIKFNQAESNFQVGNDTITLSGSANDTITLTISDNKITTVEGLTSDKIHTIKGLSAGTKVKVAAGQTVNINGDNQALNVSTAVTAIAKDGGYSQIEEVAAGTQFTTIQNGTVIVPTAAGNFFFADEDHVVTLAEVHNLKAGASNTLAEIENLLNGQSVKFAGDFTNVKLGNNSVTFTGATSGSKLKITMGADYKVATVENLLGTISGLPEGATVKVEKTDGEVTINEQDLTTSAAVKVETSAGGYKKITDVAAGTTITATQAVDIVTKEVGTFTIGGKKFEVVGDTSVTFKTDASGAVTEVNDITNAKLKIYSAVTLSVNGVSFSIPAPTSNNGYVELSIDAAGNISSLNINSQARTYTVPDGLSVEVNSNSAVTINGKSVTVDNDGDSYKVRAKSDGYDQISDVAAGATISAAESGTIIVPKEAGTFTVGSNVVKLNEVHNLKVGAGNTLAEIENLTNGQSVDLKSAFNTNLTLGNNTITNLTGATTSQALTVKIGDGNNISSVENLRGTIKGLPEGAEVKIAADTDGININADAAPLKSTVNEVTAIAKDGGYKQVKVKDGDIITAVASGVEVVTTAAGTFKVGSQQYKTDDAQIKLTTGDGNKVISVTEIDNGKTLEIYQTEESLTVGNDAIAITGGDYSSTALKLTMDANGNISLVENLQSAISGLIAGTQIKSTSSNQLTVNGETFQTSSTVEYIMTAKVGGYEKVTIKPDTVVTSAVAGTKLVTNGDGDYQFGNNHKFGFEGDAEVTLTVDDNDTTKISEISGITNATLKVYKAESSLKVNGVTVAVPAPSAGGDGYVSLTIDGNGKVAGMSGSASGEYNLDEGSTINIKTNAEVTINGKALQISDTDYTVRAKGTNEGYDLITGVNSGATFTKVDATNVSITTDGAGTYTFPSSHVFNTNDSQIIFVVGDTADEVKQIQGLDVGLSVELRANETALKVGNDELTIAGITSGNYATLTMGDNGTISAVKNLQGNVSGLSAGALVEVKTTEELQVNSVALQVNGNHATVRAKSSGNGYDAVTIKSGDVVSSVLQDVSIVADGIGTYEVNGHKFYTNDSQITLVTGDANNATAISGLDEGRSIALYDAETGLKIGNDTFTITGNEDGTNQQATLTMGSNGTISSVKNLRGDVNGLQAGALAQVSIATAISFNADNPNLQISETNTDYTVRATADGYDLVTGIGDGANIQTFKGNASIVTNAQGTYTFNNKAYVVDGDNSVTIKANDNGSGVAERIAAVDGLNGSIKGDFVEGIDIDGKKVKVTGDTEISIAADGSRAVQIYGVNTGAVVEKAGGASTISTDVLNGTFQFGESNQHTYQIAANTGDATVNFLTNSWVDYSPVVTGIKNLGDAAQVVIYGDETALNVELDTITVKGADENNLLTLTMEGDTIKSVENLLGEVSGLRTGAEVAVKDADVTINGAALKIDEGSGAADYTAYALTGGGYGTITGIGNNAVIDTAANVSIVADVDKTADADAKTTIKFKDGTNSTKDFVIKEDSTNGDGKVTLATDAQSKVTAIGGLYGTLQSPEQYNVVNGATIYSTSKDVSIVANKTADDGISGLYGLTKDQAVTVPSGTSVTVKGASAVSEKVNFTINGTAYNLMGDTNGIIIKDKTIKNLATSARLTIGAAGNYVVNGTSLTITEGKNVVVGEGTAAHLANDGDIASFTPAEEIVEKILGEGAPSVKASDDGYSADISTDNSAVIINADNKTANLTGNNVLAVVESEKNDAVINITGTNDSVVSAGTATVNLSTSTNAVLMQTGGTMTVSNYDHTKGASIQLTNSDVIALVKDSMTFSGTSLTIDGNTNTTTINHATGAPNIINFRSLEGDIQKVGYTTSTTNTIDTRTLSGDFVFKRGNEVTSIFYGGGGNDTAFGSAGDYFDLGDGDNYLEIATSGNASVGLTATDGFTEVKGFNNTYDIVKLDASVANAYYTSKGLIFTNGNASLQVDDIMPSSSNSAHVNVNIIDTSDGTNSPIEIAVARENGAIVASNSDNVDAYVGKNSGLDFSDSEFTQVVNIDLRTGTGTIGTDAVTFKGITSLKGGATEHTLIGSASESTTIRAGKDAGSISGGGSTADLLIGNSDANKTAGSTFDFTSGSGNDTLSNITFYDAANAAKADKILLTQLENLTASNIGSNVVLGYANNSTDSLTVENALGKTFRVTSGTQNVYLNVGSNEVEYGGTNNSILYATGENAKLKLSAMGADSAKLVNLSGDDNFTVKGSFAVLDGSDGGEHLGLIGNSNSNTIIAANVGSSLYGSGGDNSLVGGDGADEFWAGWESGDQTLSGVSASDTIYLYNFHKTRIKNANIEAAESNSIKITTKLGSIKIVPSNDNREYKFTIKLGDKDGTHYDDMTLEQLKEAISAGTSSADLVDDYEGENWSNDQIVADPNEDENIFWDGYGESGDLAENNVGNFDYLNSVTTGNIEFTISGGKDSLDGWNNK